VVSRNKNNASKLAPRRGRHCRNIVPSTIAKDTVAPKALPRLLLLCLAEG